MNDRMMRMRKFFIVDKKQKEVWQPEEDPYILANRYEKNNVNPLDRAADRLIYVLNKEKAVVFADEKIAFTRTVTTIPKIFTESEMEQIKEKHWIHESGDVSNINVDYSMLLDKGFVAKRQELMDYKDKFTKLNEPEKVHYLELQIEILDAITDLAERYQKQAEKQGNKVVAETLKRVPAYAPTTFLEALQMFRIIHFTMWCGNNYHNTIGRFDQFMYPYFIKDIENGTHTKESALDLLEEFFLTFNRDSDLYPGIQQGDNGQSMVLGGLNIDGSESYNPLSELCLQASLELKVIDPKINLRVNKNTSIEVYEKATQLTKQGLGFPQYSNDDVVIPGLIDLGYDEEDAYNYAVAACWEFVIPGLALDIPNVQAFSFPKAVEDAVIEQLEQSSSFDDFKEHVNRKINEQADWLAKEVKNIYIFPAPFISLMMKDSSKNAKDVSLGSKYNNYGFHGNGLASAVDSMAAIKKYVFDEENLSSEVLVDALINNYEGYDEIQNMLRYEAPKMGNNDDYADDIAVWILDVFADSLKGKTNERGGIFRAGTGSAMFYIWHSKELKASADGRSEGEGFGCNYSPNLFTKCKGPISIIKSFTKPNLKRVINGGPLTLELHDTVFRTLESTKKAAILVKSFIELGGHQLQLNAVNRQVMLDAQKNPKDYRNLIVRVWGWSGYFVELDKEYQDHIIKRSELMV